MEAHNRSTFNSNDLIAVIACYLSACSCVASFSSLCAVLTAKHRAFKYIICYGLIMVTKLDISGSIFVIAKLQERILYCQNVYMSTADLQLSEMHCKILLGT